MGKEYMSSSNAVIPIILVLSFLSTIGVIYGTLELSDDERNAWEVLKDLLSGKISLQDIWRVLSGRNAEAKAAGACQGVDQNGVYEYDKDGKCIKLGCKLGYYEQDNICIERRNFSDEVFSGQTSADCELDLDAPYTYGQCLDKVTGQILTGDENRCGIGKKKKSPNVSLVQIGSGSCPSVEYVDCEVPCPKKCRAPESLWVEDVDHGCRAIKNGESVILGEDSGFCGMGTKIIRLSEDAITGDLHPGMSLSEYKESINFSVCESEKGPPCEVKCTEGLIDIGCPSTVDSWDWIVANQGKVYTEDSAQRVLRREISIADATEMPAITRDDAINKYEALDKSTGDVDEEKLPKGKQIWFKAGEEYSYEYLSKEGCAIVELRDAAAPRIAADVEYEAKYGDCQDIKCGQWQQRNVTYNITTPAWGNGDTYVPSSHTAYCDDTSLPCCMKDSSHYTGGSCDNGTKTFTQDTSACITDEQIQNGSTDPLTYTKECCTQSEWKEVEDYDGCELIGNNWKRKFTRDVTTGCTDDNAIEEKYEDRGNCNFDCEINSITMGNKYNGDESGYMCQARSTWRTRQVSAIDFRDPKGSGKACPTGVEGKYYFNTQDLKDALGDIEGPVPDFQCEMASFHNTLGKLNFVESRNCPSELENFERCGVIFNRPNLYFGKDGPPEPTEQGGGLDPSNSPDGVSTGGRM